NRLRGWPYCGCKFAAAIAASYCGCSLDLRAKFFRRRPIRLDTERGELRDVCGILCGRDHMLGQLVDERSWCFRRREKAVPAREREAGKSRADGGYVGKLRHGRWRRDSEEPHLPALRLRHEV